METADMKRFSMVMNYLALNFPTREVTQPLVQSYFDVLSDYSIDDIEKAAKICVKTCFGFPFVANFTRLLSPESFPGNT